METLLIQEAISGTKSNSDESFYVDPVLGQGQVLAVEGVCDPADLLLGGQGEDLVVKQNWKEFDTFLGLIAGDGGDTLSARYR